MMNSECVFCGPETQGNRVINIGSLAYSMISDPQFRVEQCLVIPRRHIETVSDLTSDESSEIMLELGRIGCLLDKGFGTGIMQKFQPLQAENGIKVSHLHFHVFPRLAEEAGLFPVPEPNSFDGFYPADLEKVEALAKELRK